MQFVPIDSQTYPQMSPSGDQGDLFDTGWDVLHPGPARIYLSEADIHDVVGSEGVLSRPSIFDLLVMRGWTAPDTTAVEVETLERDLEDALAEVESLTEKAAAFETTIRSLGTSTSSSPVGLMFTHDAVASPGYLASGTETSSATFIVDPLTDEKE